MITSCLSSCLIKVGTPGPSDLKRMNMLAGGCRSLLGKAISRAVLGRAISRVCWGEPATEEDRVKAQGNKAQPSETGREISRVTRRIHQPMCYTQPCRCSKTETPRRAARPQAEFPVGRRRCGYVWKHHRCQVEVGSPEERQREEVGTAPNSQEKGPALFAPLFFPLLSGNLSSLAPAWAS